MFDSGLVVEDLPDAQTWLATALSGAFPKMTVTTVGNFSDASRAIRNRSFDVALVDLRLPDGHGIDLLTQASRTRPEMRTVVTTVYDDDAHLFPALRAGARGYLLKDDRKEDLIRQLQSLSRDEVPLSPPIAQSVLRFFSHAGPAGDLPPETLTPREREVLIALANGYTLADIARTMKISQNTVATHVKRIYGKLNIGSRAEAVCAALRMGLLARS